MINGAFVNAHKNLHSFSEAYFTVLDGWIAIFETDALENWIGQTQLSLLDRCQGKFNLR